MLPHRTNNVINTDTNNTAYHPRDRQDTLPEAPVVGVTDMLLDKGVDVPVSEADDVLAVGTDGVLLDTLEPLLVDAMPLASAAT